MKPSMLMAALLSTFGFGSSVSSKSNQSKRGKATPALVNKRNASHSQRVMRIEQGMRPREAVHARKIERRSKHAIKGTPCNN